MGRPVVGCKATMELAGKRVAVVVGERGRCGVVVGV